MEIPTLLMVVFALALVLAAWEARRLGNDRRDVALLATVAGLMGAGAAVSAVA